MRPAYRPRAASRDSSGGILSTLTGLYPDRNGQTVSNSYAFFNPASATGSTFTSSFKYWTDPVDDSPSSADPRPNMIAETGKQRPRRGCRSPELTVTWASQARPT